MALLLVERMQVFGIVGGQGQLVAKLLNPLDLESAEAFQNLGGLGFSFVQQSGYPLGLEGFGEEESGQKWVLGLLRLQGDVSQVLKSLYPTGGRVWTLRSGRLPWAMVSVSIAPARTVGPVCDRSASDRRARSARPNRRRPG